MSEMVERVAKAIAEADGRDYYTARMSGLDKAARAAIAAMREPTPEMIACGKEALLADRHRILSITKQSVLPMEVEDAIEKIDLAVAFRAMHAEMLK